MSRLMTGIVLGAVLAALVLVGFRAIDTERVPAAETGAASDQTSTETPHDAEPQTNNDDLDDRTDTQMFDPSDGTNNAIDRNVGEPPSEAEPAGNPRRPTPFDEELEHLRELGLDAYRMQIILMLEGAGGGVQPDVIDNEQPTADERSTAPVDLRKPDSLKPLHDDSSGLSSDHRLIDDLILEHAPQFGFDVRLLHAICQIESNFNVKAVSPRMAKGAFQLIDATSARFNVRDPFDPKENLLGALRYLQFLENLYGRHRLDLILSAYNCGEQCVERFGWRVPPIPETRAYVQNVLRLYRQTA
ncbi:MAG: lytic transglycosylase domain-containing protein [Acidobacteria bacterium]|nr:lytic transglycosylase domain-containing protein [Acidobacteriota bacterium]